MLRGSSPVSPHPDGSCRGSNKERHPLIAEAIACPQHAWRARSLSLQDSGGFRTPRWRRPACLEPETQGRATEALGDVLAVWRYQLGRW